MKAAAEISMGTEVSEEDINNIIHLCDQVCTREWIAVGLYFSSEEPLLPRRAFPRAVLTPVMAVMIPILLLS